MANKLKHRARIVRYFHTGLLKPVGAKKSDYAPGKVNFSIIKQKEILTMVKKN